MIKSPDQKPIKYDGKGFTYGGLFDFINVYSETFVFKGTEDIIESAASKPWLSEPVPQLHALSANDICLKKDGALCAILLVKDAASKDQATLDMLHATAQTFSSKINRGITFAFSWLDANHDPEFF